MQTLHGGPSRVGMLPEKEYGVEFVVKASDEAIALAEGRDWKRTYQMKFYGLGITYCEVTVFKEPPVPQIVFEIAFTAPHSTLDEPIYLDVVGQLLTDYAAFLLGTGNIDTEEMSWISTRMGEPGEISTFFHKGYEGEQIGEEDKNLAEKLADTLRNIGTQTGNVGKFVLIGIGGIALIKLLDVMED